MEALPIIIFIVVIILLIAGFLIFAVKFLTKGRKSAWSGEVVNKEHTEWDDENALDRDHYILRVKMDDGKIRNIGTNLQFYNEVNIGDRIKKEKGTVWPKKI